MGGCQDAALFDAAGTLWQDQARSEARTPVTKQKALKPLSLAVAASDGLDDDWSNWDSPAPKSPTRWSGSTVASDPATPSNNINDSCVVNGVASHAIRPTDKLDTPLKRDEIPWPALNQLTPSALKRTMSTVMQEWEKSLTPPPEEQQDLILKSPVSEKREEIVNGGE
jgi:hypothetical protein